MKLITLLVIFGTLRASCSALYFPSYIKKCSEADPNINECIREQINILVPKLESGLKRMHIPPLRPVNFNEVTAELGDMHLELADGEIFGLEQIVVKSVEFNKDAQTLKLVGSTPEFSIKSKYETSGKIFVLPIEGKGDFETVLSDLDFSINVKLANLERENTEPIKYIDSDFNYSYKKGKFFFDNLFNGKKELSDPVLKLINEEHQQISKEFKPVITATAKAIIKAILGPILKFYKYSDIVLE